MNLYGDRDGGIGNHVLCWFYLLDRNPTLLQPYECISVDTFSSAGATGEDGDFVADGGVNGLELLGS
ncbi:MAG: hypothetical protein L0322_27225 [Chloroflexi bacterium]|nr:hypothetical protein [Chloroflexota bacterium]